MTDSFDFASQRLLAIFAHPDDEAFGCAGTFALLTDLGAKVSLVCATRGEAGEISDPALATPETLGAVRENELFGAMAFVGVTDVRFLGYRDSGMEDTDENNDPRAFVNAQPLAVVETLGAIIAELKPDAVLTFGPDGIYGHPDHLMISRVATAAVLTSAWESPALYYNAMPRERFQELAKREEGPFASLAREVVANMGTPSSQIDVWVDVAPELDRKRQALLAHRTQMGPNGPMSDLPREEVGRMQAMETFRRIPLPWKTPATTLLDRLPQAERLTGPEGA